MNENPEAKREKPTERVNLDEKTPRNWTHRAKKIASVKDQGSDPETAESLVRDLETKEEKGPDGKIFMPENFSDRFKNLIEFLLKVVLDLEKGFEGTPEELKEYFQEGDWERAFDGDPIDPSFGPRELAQRLGNRYGSRIKLDGMPNLSKYRDGDRLGTRQCARFVSDALGLRRIVWSAQELFQRLYLPEKDGNISNLKTNIEDLKVGDVVFFKGTYRNGRTITHTGIIVSTGPLLMRHHATFRKGIETVAFDDYWRKHFYAGVYV